MRTNTRVRVLLAVMMMAAAVTTAQIRVGILPRLAATELNKMFTPLADYLSKETGTQVVIVIPKDFAAFAEMERTKQFDYSFANPNVYVEARNALGASVEPLAIAVEAGTGKTFTGCFLVRKGSPIKSLGDLKGHKGIFVDEQSAGGYLSQVVTMKNAGVSRKDITILPFAKKHTNVALAIQNGAADFGGIRTADFATIRTQVAIPDVVILSESQAIPNWPFYALPGADKGATEKIRKALLDAKAHPEVLKGAKIDAFVPATDGDFDILRQMAKAAKEF